MDGNGTNQEGDEQICKEVDGETLFRSWLDNASAACWWRPPAGRGGGVK